MPRWLAVNSYECSYTAEQGFGEESKPSNENCGKINKNKIEEKRVK